MKRFVPVLVTALLASGIASPAEAKKVTIRWHGQSFFELESSQGTRLVFDPHAIEEYPRVSVKADLILLSHLHNDHTRTDVVENERKAKILVGLKAQGQKLDWNPIDEKFRDVHVRSVGTYHDAMQGTQRGKNTIFVLEIDGMRIVHLGDLGHLLSEAQLKGIGAVDVLMIPVGGVYTINGEEAKKVVEQLKPKKYILPMHYGTKVFDKVMSIDEFIDEEKNVKVMPGNKLTVSSDFKPSAPVIVQLNWK